MGYTQEIKDNEKINMERIMRKMFVDLTDVND